MNLISETHYSCERMKYAFMVLQEYTIIFPWIDRKEAICIEHFIVCQEAIQTTLKLAHIKKKKKKKKFIAGFRETIYSCIVLICKLCFSLIVGTYSNSHLDFFSYDQITV